MKIIKYGDNMNIFDCNARQLVLLSALIADQIALEYSTEQQAVIEALLRSIAENINIYIALEAGNEENE